MGRFEESPASWRATGGVRVFASLHAARSRLGFTVQAGWSAMARSANHATIAAVLAGTLSCVGLAAPVSAQTARSAGQADEPSYWPSRAPQGVQPASQTATGPPEEIYGQPKIGSLAWAIAGAWRIEPERDRWRHPVETLEFFGLRPDMTVLEAWPGAGWYTSILAPYLHRGGGRLVVAHFDGQAGGANQRRSVQSFQDRFLGDPDLYGSPVLSVLSRDAPPPVADNSVDLVVTFRNVHNWMAAGWPEKAFQDFYRVLRPGGVLGVEEHRAAASGEQDPQARDGYVQVAYMKRLALDAGFEFVAESEINANPADTRDHPFGVWTLPPVLRTSPPGLPPDPTFDPAPYRMIGESDRMTLKFRKPLAGRGSAQPGAQAAPPP
jgi:predicted methyltransferase